MEEGKQRAQLWSNLGWEVDGVIDETRLALSCISSYQLLNLGHGFMEVLHIIFTSFIYV